MRRDSLPFYCRGRQGQGYGYTVTKSERLAEIELADAHVAAFDGLLELVGAGFVLPDVRCRSTVWAALEAFAGDRGAELAAVLGFSRLEILAANYAFYDDDDFALDAVERWTASRRRRLYKLGQAVLERFEGVPYWGAGDLETLRKQRRAAMTKRARARRAIAQGRAK